MQAGQRGRVVRRPLPPPRVPKAQAKNSPSPVALVDGCACAKAAWPRKRFHAEAGEPITS
jgi:hypothetical protein